jgi:ribosomal protein S25
MCGRECEAPARHGLVGRIKRTESHGGKNLADDHLHLELSEARAQAPPDPSAEWHPWLTLTVEESLGSELSGVRVEGRVAVEQVDRDHQNGSGGDHVAVERDLLPHLPSEHRNHGTQPKDFLDDGIQILIVPPGTSTLTRVHGAYVSETEINKLTAFWKEQGAPVYDQEILKPRDEDMGEDGGEDELADELYDQAIAAVSTMQMVSISMLQRKMRIGYNRAARMIERMERDGIVGPADGAKPREVLIKDIGDMPNM